MTKKLAIGQLVLLGLSILFTLVAVGMKSSFEGIGIKAGFSNMSTWGILGFVFGLLGLVLGILQIVFGIKEQIVLGWVAGILGLVGGIIWIVAVAAIIVNIIVILKKK